MLTAEEDARGKFHIAAYSPRMRCSQDLRDIAFIGACCGRSM